MPAFIRFLNLAMLLACLSIGSQAWAQSGGIVFQDGDHILHVFYSSGIFVPPDGITEVEVLVVAGGGGGGGSSGSHRAGGGGGAGELLHETNYPVSGIMDITVGAGGEGGPPEFPGANGSHSLFGSLAVTGGGGGGRGLHTRTWSTAPGNPGGCGGGGGALRVGEAPGGAGEQGGNGGDGFVGGSFGGGGGGGGADGNGADAAGDSGGSGGSGRYFPQFSDYGMGGAFSRGGDGGSRGGIPGPPAPAHTGYGGQGGGGSNNAGGNGGSGIVILRYLAPFVSLSVSGTAVLSLGPDILHAGQGQTTATDQSSSLTWESTIAGYYNRITASIDWGTVPAGVALKVSSDSGSEIVLSHIDQDFITGIGKESRTEQLTYTISVTDCNALSATTGVVTVIYTIEKQ